MATCNRCGGWIELGINDVHGWCSHCKEWVGNLERIDMCNEPGCPMCNP